MPYIKEEARKTLEYGINVLANLVLEETTDLAGMPVDRAGVLNYAITTLLDNVYGPLADAKYKDYNEIIGMLECCKLEFYRKAVAPYEDIKLKENGPVLDGGLDGLESRNRGDFRRKRPVSKGTPVKQLNYCFAPTATVSKVLNHNLVVYKFSPHEGTTIFIKATSFKMAQDIILKECATDYIDLIKESIPGKIHMYKNWNDLEPEIKNVFHALERDNLPANKVVFNQIAQAPVKEDHKKETKKTKIPKYKRANPIQSLFSEPIIKNKKSI